MVLLLYIILLILISFIMRKQRENIRAAVRLVYNWFFIVGTFVICYLLNFSGSSEELFNAFSESLYSAVLGMTFGGDLDWAETMSVSFHAQMWLILFIASVMTVESVLATLFGRLIKQLRITTRGMGKKQQYIIVGLENDALFLADEIRKNVKNPYIVYILIGAIEEDSRLYEICRVARKDYLFRLNHNKEYYMALLPCKDLMNLDILSRLNDTYPDRENIHATVFLDNDIIRFHDIRMCNIDAYVVSTEQVLINKFFDQICPIDILRRKHAFSDTDVLPILEKPFDIAVIGFGGIGKEYLLYSFENSAFITKSGYESFHALVIDHDLDTKKEQFLTEAPYFEACSQIDFANTSIGSEEYYNTIQLHAKDLSQIMISTGDSRLNIKTAIDLCRFFDRIDFYNDRPQIIVILNEQLAGIDVLLDHYTDIITIDINEQIINYETLIERKTSFAAKEINEQYNKNSGKDISWNQLGTFTQASNCAVIRDRYNKQALP